MNGFEATVWRVETAGRVLAVRLMRRGVPAREEVEALRLAARHHQPVPRIVATGAIAGCDFIVMSWCDGVTIGDLLVTGGDPEGLGKLLGAAQADLHRPIDESGSALCHLDFQPFNVRVRDGEVTGIVDWSNARIGDCRDDIAWTQVAFELAPALLPDLAADVHAVMTGWRGGYAEHRRLPDDTELSPFLAYAAARQLADWDERFREDTSLADVAAAARDIRDRWRG
ncbi:MAG: phosphotransferase [Nocardioidaceae bacterium]|nr:phosphotransferase [Nocardioidaceae bacterium]